jgi:hypothetical protein
VDGIYLAPEDDTLSKTRTLGTDGETLTFGSVRHGISHFADLVGGFAAWDASPLATVAESAATA